MSLTPGGGCTYVGSPVALLDVGAPACSPSPSTLVSTLAQELDPLLAQALKVRRPDLWSCLLFRAVLGPIQGGVPAARVVGEGN